MTFTLISSAFREGETIPALHTCDGEDRSPELSWQDAPVGTGSFALIFHDPDSAFGDFTHWILYNIPAHMTTLPEGEGDAHGTPGVNGFGKSGYGGPCPRQGEHRYVFEFSALDVETLGLAEDAGRKEVEAAMQGHVLAHTTLMGRYQRPADRQQPAPIDPSEASVDDSLDASPDGDRQLTTESDAIDTGLNDSDLGADVAGDIGPKHR